MLNLQQSTGITCLLSSSRKIWFLLVSEKSQRKHEIIIHVLTVMPDHVHIMVTLPHNITDSKALMLLKGGSAYLFFKHHPKSRLRLPKGHLWSAGGCAVTVGYNEYSTVEKYIENQETHHAQT